MSESVEIKRALDYQIGDLVQVTTGKNAGMIGRIVDIRLFPEGYILQYIIHSKGEFYKYRGENIRFLSHQEDE